MKAHPYFASVALAVFSACSTSPTAPTVSSTAGPLVVAISPNPLVLPAAGQQLVWNVTFRDSGNAGVRLNRSETLVTDGNGANVAERKDFWSKSAGCSVCSDDIYVAPGRGLTFSGMTAAILRIPRGDVRFRHTTFFTDDNGTEGSITVEIPVG